LKVLRWHVLLRPGVPRLSLPRVAGSFLAAQMLNAVFPVRLGEVSRVAVMGSSGLEYAFVAGSVVVEKILDTLGYGVLFLLLLVLFPLPGWFVPPVKTFVVLALLVVGVTWVLLLERERLAQSGTWVIRFFPARWKNAAARHLQAGLDSLAVLRHSPTLAWVSILTAFVWGSALLNTQMALLALGIRLPLVAPLLLLIALQVGISLPSLPGKVGVFEYICVLSLAIYGVGRPIGLSYGILLHAIVFIPIIVSGLLAVWLLPKDLSSS